MIAYRAGQQAEFRSGLDRISDGDVTLARDERLGLLLNQASVSSTLDLATQVIHRANPGQLRMLFTPQHGLWGEAQANMIETPHSIHATLGIPIHSLYSETRRPYNAVLSEIDRLVIDLQDVGTRVYTFIWTIVECLRACRECDRPVTILDRPNPVGGSIIEGPLLHPGFESFVGGAGVPMRHGLTIGELAVWLNRELKLDARLDVVEMTGWEIADSNPTSVTWIAPSPNLPTRQSTLVYPGQVLLEGTNISEGRGTTRPFECCGAPFIDAEQLCTSVNDLSLAGVKFLPIQFRPTFDKWQGESCGGVNLQVTDPVLFRPYATSVTLLALICRRHPAHFAWLEPPYEYEERLPPIDIISGGDTLRRTIDNLRHDALPPRSPLDQIDDAITVDAEAWFTRTRDTHLYPRDSFVC
jgi:uncharacterized protein YbbC (DUF1343 family)